MRNKISKNEVKRKKKEIKNKIFEKMSIPRTMMNINSEWKEYIQTEIIVYCKEIKEDCLLREFGEEIICKKNDYLVYLNGVFFKCKKEEAHKLFITSELPYSARTNIALQYLNKILPKEFALIEEISVSFWTKLKWLFIKNIVISLRKYSTDSFLTGCDTRLGIKICKKGEKE